MKRLVLSLAAACSLAPAFAQKGEILYYGNLGGSTSSGQMGGGSFTAGIKSGLGYQLSNHFTLGVQGGISMTGSGGKGQGAHGGSFSGGLFSRYTSTLSDRFYVYLQGDASYIAERMDGPGQQSLFMPGNQTEPGKNGGPGKPGGPGAPGRGMGEGALGANLFPGVGMNIGHRWSLNMELDALHLRMSPGNFSAGFNGGQGYRFGVSKYFGGARKAAAAAVPAAN